LLKDDFYDPDLHGDEQAPHAQRGMALALTVLIFSLPFAAWALLDFIGAA
jgi:hypothetical protein